MSWSIELSKGVFYCLWLHLSFVGRTLSCLALKWPNVYIRHQQKISAFSCLHPKIVCVSLQNPSLVKTSPDTSPSYLLFNPCPVLILSSLHLSTSHFPNHPSSLSTLPVFPGMLSLPVFLNPSSLLFALAPCPSHSHQRTFGETLQTCLFALLSSSFVKKSQPLSSDDMFYSWPFKGKDFSRTFATTENVIYQLGCVPPLGNVTVLTVLWWLSCLSLIVGLDYDKLELSMTQLHCWNIFRAI